MDQHLTVKTVVSLSGINEHTLRAWETRYQAVVPKRTKSGRRIYSLADVEKIKLLCRLLTGGYSIGGVASLSIKELELLEANLASQTETQSKKMDTDSALVKSEPDHSSCVEAIIKSLKKYQLDDLQRELIRARTVFTARTLILEIFGTLMTEVGELVKSGKLGIDQEHALSAILRDQLGDIFRSLQRRDTDVLRVVLTTQEGDLHEFGILMSAILCAYHGFSVYYLGPNLPPDDFAAAANRTRAHLAVLGCTPLPSGTTKDLQKNYLKRLAERLNHDIEIFVGGECKIDFKKVSFKRSIRHVPTLKDLDQLMIRFNKI